MPTSTLLYHTYVDVHIWYIAECCVNVYIQIVETWDLFKCKYNGLHFFLHHCFLCVFVFASVLRRKCCAMCYLHTWTSRTPSPRRRPSPMRYFMHSLFTVFFYRHLRNVRGARAIERARLSRLLIEPADWLVYYSKYNIYILKWWIWRNWWFLFVAKKCKLMHYWHDERMSGSCISVHKRTHTSRSW